MCRPNGAPWCGEKKQYPALDEFAPAANFHFPEPEHPAALRTRYHAERPFTVSPRVPEPYYTFDETFTYGWEVLYDDMPGELDTYVEKYSYGPDGDFGKRYFERDMR